MAGDGDQRPGQQHPCAVAEEVEDILQHGEARRHRRPIHHAVIGAVEGRLLPRAQSEDQVFCPLLHGAHHQEPVDQPERQGSGVQQRLEHADARCLPQEGQQGGQRAKPEQAPDQLRGLRLQPVLLADIGQQRQGGTGRQGQDPDQGRLQQQTEQNGQNGIHGGKHRPLRVIGSGAVMKGIPGSASCRRGRSLQRETPPGPRPGRLQAPPGRWRSG